MKKKSNIFYLCFLITIVIFCANFTDGAKKETETLTPEFVSLLEGEGILTGTIYDDKNIIPVKELSFTGHSRIGGIRRNSDDSVSVLDLTKIKELKILKGIYVSPRYQDKEYILAQVTSANGAITKDLLIPRDLVICGIATETEMEKAWFLKKTSRVEVNIEKNIPVIEAPTVILEQTN